MKTTIHNIMNILMGYAALKYSMGIYRFNYDNKTHILTFSGDGMTLFKAVVFGDYKDSSARFVILEFEDVPPQTGGLMSLYNVRQVVIEKLGHYVIK